MSEMLSIREVAARLGVGPAFVQRRCRSGELPAVRIGSDYRVHAADVEAWLARLQATAPAQVPARAVAPPTDDLLRMIDGWFSYLGHVRALSPNTIRTYREQMRGLLKRLGAAGHTDLSVSTLFDRQALMGVFARIPPASFSIKMNTYNALTSFAKYLIADDKLPPAALDGLKAIKPRRQVEPRRTVLKPEDVARLFDVILTRPNPPADNLTVAAMVACMVYGGLRVSEVCRLKHADVDLDARVLTVVHGKGGKTRRVGIASALFNYLARYQAARPRGAAFFLQAHGEPYDKDMLGKRIRVVSKRMGVSITCHGLRRTFATLAAGQGRSVNYLRLALGHSHLATTQTYLRTSEDEVVAAMKTW